MGLGIPGSLTVVCGVGGSRAVSAGSLSGRGALADGKTNNPTPWVGEKTKHLEGGPGDETGESERSWAWRREEEKENCGANAGPFQRPSS